MRTISNEQKAIEIAKEYSRPYGFGLNNDSSIECYQSAIKAMEWKDKEYKQERQQMIEKTISFLQDFHLTHDYVDIMVIEDEYRKLMEE